MKVATFGFIFLSYMGEENTRQSVNQVCGQGSVDNSI